MKYFFPSISEKAAPSSERSQNYKSELYQLRMVCCPLALFAAKGSNLLWCCLKIPLCPSWAYFARFTFSVDKE